MPFASITPSKLNFDTVTSNIIVGAEKILFIMKTSSRKKQPTINLLQKLFRKNFSVIPYHLPYLMDIFLLKTSRHTIMLSNQPATPVKKPTRWCRQHIRHATAVPENEMPAYDMYWKWRCSCFWLQTTVWQTVGNKYWLNSRKCCFNVQCFKNLMGKATFKTPCLDLIVALPYVWNILMKKLVR